MQVQSSQRFNLNTIVFDIVALVAAIVGYVSVSMTWFGTATGNELIAGSQAGRIAGGFYFSADSGTTFMLPNSVITASLLAAAIAIIAIIISFFPQRKYKHFVYIALLFSGLYGFSYYVIGYFNGRQAASEFDYWLSTAVGVGMWIGAAALAIIVLISVIGLAAHAQWLRTQNKG